MVLARPSVAATSSSDARGAVGRSSPWYLFIVSASGCSCFGFVAFSLLVDWDKVGPCHVHAITRKNEPPRPGWECRNDDKASNHMLAFHRLDERFSIPDIFLMKAARTLLGILGEMEVRNYHDALRSPHS